MKQSGLVLAVAASIYVLYNFTVTSFIVAEMGETFSLGRIFLAEVVVFIPVGAFFITVQELYKTKRWLFTSISVKTAAIHLLLLVMLIAVHSVWQVYFNSLLIGANFIVDTIIRDVMGFLNLRVLIYIISIGLAVGMVKIQEKENRLLNQSEIKLKLQKENFKQLELKLNPEIIYPNLDFIKKNMHENPEKASALLLNLSKQLRNLIDNIQEERIPVKKNLQFLEHYLKALKLRLGRELSYHQKIDDFHLDIEIPSLVLMAPFFEQLFFGRYADFTRQVEKVVCRSTEINADFIHLVLEFYPIEQAETLEGKLKNDDQFAEINDLLAPYAGSTLKAEVDNDCLSIYLYMKVE
ncbi:histidine kinase [Aliifodinibius salicampi]|uniref:Histidine kinase n=1 Tax=Fodinibius salicampi TaxID=1920655 RepID=A0ABT3Q189_9BACT|nr:histidine kinase [Fodinibius salicampi]MCW9713846.1 histidine kinase [Fodinibius salicampi]